VKKAGWDMGDDVPHTTQPVPCEDKWFPLPGQIPFSFKTRIAAIEHLAKKPKTLGKGLPYSLTVLAFCGKAITQVVKYFLL